LENSKMANINHVLLLTRIVPLAGSWENSAGMKEIPDSYQ
jgi:hypothetical protein